VKLGGDTLLTVPAVPPVAGPDRALDPIRACGPPGAGLVSAEPLLEVALMIPTAPPAITTTTAPMARGLFSLRASICVSVRV